MSFYFIRMYRSDILKFTDPTDSEATKRYKEERESKERDGDAELAREIAQRKESTNERGIKLTVVLIASRRMLGDLSHS